MVTAAAHKVLTEDADINYCSTEWKDHKVNLKFLTLTPPPHGFSTALSSASNYIHSHQLYQIQWDPLKASNVEIIGYDFASRFVNYTIEECRRRGKETVRWSIKTVWWPGKDAQGDLRTVEGTRLHMQRDIWRGGAFVSWHGSFHRSTWPSQGAYKAVSNLLIFHKSIFCLHCTRTIELEQRRLTGSKHVTSEKGNFFSFALFLPY